MPIICRKSYRISTIIPISSVTKPLAACGKAGSSTPRAMGSHQPVRFIEICDLWMNAGCVLPRVLNLNLLMVYVSEGGIYIGITVFVETSVLILASSGGHVSEVGGCQPFITILQRLGGWVTALAANSEPFS